MTLGTEPQHLLKVYARVNVALALNNNVTHVAGGHEVPHVSPSFYLCGKRLGLLSPDEKVFFGHLCVVYY
jgi:hypothetical protein